MHPEKLGLESCNLNSIFKVIDKETQTNESESIVKNSDSSVKSFRLPLPRELEKQEEGTLKVFSFCQVIQDPECPKSVTIIRESVTEEVHVHPESPNDQAFSNRYRYCKEVIKPYLKDYPPDCPDSGELLLRDAIEAANEEFPEYPPCYEIPDDSKKSEDCQEDKDYSNKQSNKSKKSPVSEEKKESNKTQGNQCEEPPVCEEKPENYCDTQSKQSKSPPVCEENSENYCNTQSNQSKTPPVCEEKKENYTNTPEYKSKKKPVTQKQERRKLVLCPNQDEPKICIHITDPELCEPNSEKLNDECCEETADTEINCVKKSTLESSEHCPSEDTPKDCPPKEDEVIYCSDPCERPRKEAFIPVNKQLKPPSQKDCSWPPNSDNTNTNKKDSSAQSQNRRDCLSKLLDNLKSKADAETCTLKKIPLAMNSDSQKKCNKPPSDSEKKCNRPPSPKKCIPKPPPDSPKKCIPKPRPDSPKKCIPKPPPDSPKKCVPKPPPPPPPPADPVAGVPVVCCPPCPPCPTCPCSPSVRESKSEKKMCPSREKKGSKHDMHKGQDMKKDSSITGRPSPSSDIASCASVKSAMDAHNETLATLKCAMEDFMCAVYKSTQEAVTLITTESAKQLEKFKKSSSNTECPPPKKVCDSRSRDKLRRFSLVNIDSVKKSPPPCPAAKDDTAATPAKPEGFFDQLVHKVDSTISMISDTIHFDIPRPRAPNFNDVSSKYDIPIPKPPKDVENILNPAGTSNMFTNITSKIWSMFCEDENIDNKDLSRNSSTDSSAATESDEDLLNKLIE